jgi:hypothetical protein
MFKKIFSDIKFRTFLILILIAAIFLYCTFTWAIEFSAFSVGIAKYLISLALLLIVDKFVFKEINTMEILKNNGIAYAIFFLANAVLVGVCIATS